jgi:flagellar biogenesis protein FliO
VRTAPESVSRTSKEKAELNDCIFLRGKVMGQMQQMLAAPAVLGLLGAALWWLRRKGLGQFTISGAHSKTARRLELIERLALTPQHSLYLLRAQERVMLIGRSPSGLVLLDRFGPPPDQVSSAEITCMEENAR